MKTLQDFLNLPPNYAKVNVMVAAPATYTFDHDWEHVSPKSSILGQRALSTVILGSFDPVKFAGWFSIQLPAPSTNYRELWALRNIIEGPFGIMQYASYADLLQDEGRRRLIFFHDEADAVVVRLWLDSQK